MCSYNFPTRTYGTVNSGIIQDNYILKESFWISFLQRMVMLHKTVYWEGRMELHINSFNHTNIEKYWFLLSFNCSNQFVFPSPNIKSCGLKKKPNTTTTNN